MNARLASWWTLLLAALLYSFGVSAWAQDMDAQLNESVVMVPKKGALFTTELETTVFRPDGTGPFPVVVINHGKASGDPRFQARYRPTIAARYFLQRGYAVVVPMRQGFSKSSGNFILGGCNVESNGRVQAQDVHAVLAWLREQAWADATRVLLMGQSHGGWTTLALGAEAPQGVRALVNFAGGLRQENCPGWPGALARAAGAYGKETKLPSLWFYGDNDSYFNVDTWKAMLAAYQAGGAPAQMVAFGPFGSDSHSMFGSRAGEAIWEPEVSKLLRSVGLPDAVTLPQYGRVQRMAVPPATNFANLDDADKVPYLKDGGRKGYATFLTKEQPRAFAIAASGAWSWANGGDDPLQRALERCKKNAKDMPCHLYAVDDQVVWVQP